MGRRRAAAAARQARASRATNTRYAELAVALVAFLVPLFRKMLAARAQQQPASCPHHQELAESMRDACEQCAQVKETQAAAAAQQQQLQQQGQGQGGALAGFSAEKALKVIVAAYSLIAGYDRRSKRRSKRKTAMPLLMGGLLAKAGYSMFMATMTGGTKS